MDDRPVYIRLTPEQVGSVLQAVQASSEASVLAARVSELASRQALPPISAWEARDDASDQSQCSLALLRGLRLLSRLAGGQLASLGDLTSELGMSASVAGAYIQALVVTGMVKCDPGTDVYRLVK